MVTVLGQDLLIIFLQTFLIRNLLVMCVCVSVKETHTQIKTERQTQRECVCAHETVCEDQRLGDCLL